jgi:hypothetical protein
MSACRTETPSSAKDLRSDGIACPDIDQAIHLDPRPRQGQGRSINGRGGWNGIPGQVETGPPVQSVIQLEDGDSLCPPSLLMSVENPQPHANPFMAETLVLSIALIIRAD